jgi:hypothetical protein
LLQSEIGFQNKDSGCSKKKRIAAHLLVIINESIDATKAPVYAKSKTQAVMLWICGMSFVTD